MGLWVTSGTVAVTAGSPTVTGTGTAWDKNTVIPGYMFVGPDGNSYEVQQLMGQVLILTKPYAGATAAGQSYAIIQTAFAAQLDLLSKLQAIITTLSTDVNVAGRIAIGAPSIATGKFAVKSDSASFENAGSVLLRIAKAALSDTGFLQFETALAAKVKMGLDANDVWTLSRVNGAAVELALKIAADRNVEVSRGLKLTAGAAPDNLENGMLWQNMSGEIMVRVGGLSIPITSAGTVITTAAFGALTGAPLDNAALNALFLGKQAASPTLTTLSSATAAGLALMDDADAAAQRVTLGLGTAATQASTAFEAAGTAAGLIAAHNSLGDPHAQYALDTDIPNFNTDYAKGLAALEVVPDPKMRGEKFIILDLIGDGVAERDGATMAFSTVAARSTITRSSAALRGTRKRKPESVASGTLRDHHDFQGVPQGKFYEAAHAYLNPRSQPTVAQCTTIGIPTDTTLSANWPENWIAVGDNSTRRLIAQPLTVTSGLDYYLSAYVQMTDGSAPGTSGVHSSSGWDFYPYIAGGMQPKHPDTGANGAKIAGPFADNVYLISAYVTPAFSGATSAGIDKSTANSAKTFKLGPVSFGRGRYPPSMFDNATGSPLTRAADVHSVALSGFTGQGGITVCGEYVHPFGAADSYVLDARQSASNRIYITTAATTLFLGYFDGAGQFAISAVVAAGQKYKFAVAFDPVTGRVRGKVSGVAAPAELLTLPKTMNFTPTVLNIANIGGTTNFLGSTMGSINVIDRAWTAAEIAEWVG